MIQKNLIFLLLILYTQCYIPQNANTEGIAYHNIKPGVDPETGKCYAKCLMADTYETDTTTYLVYTGEEGAEDVDVETVKIVMKPRTTKWEKKKADKNRLSSDPDDGKVWCLVEIPADIKILEVVKDTTQTKNFRTEFVYKKRFLKKGGFTEVKEVLCSNYVTTDLIYQLQEALLERNYFFSENSGKLSTETKAALTKFQKEHNLPVGQLDMETLEALNIKPTDPQITNHKPTNY